jgi:dihydrofolate synthase / folylpolyglutamate synthase
MQNISSLGEAEVALIPFWPSNLSRHAYTLEYIERFMDNIGNPQDRVRVVHIAGTSGKTSTAYYTAALLQQAGNKVGLMTSPHIEGINERVQINLTPLPEKEFCEELVIFLDLINKSSITLSYAEILYGFAYWEFARHNVDYVVAEVGLGGLLDATNIVTREDKISVITDIGLDHTHVLGDTLSAIAEHKAGIIRLHNAVFCHPQGAEVMDVIRQRAEHKQADLHIVEQDGRTPDFLPLYQRRNFSLALEVALFALERADQKPLDNEQIVAAAHTHIPGRMEMFNRQGKQVILDNAHNAQKLHGLCTSLKAQFPDTPMALLVAFVETPGRDIQSMVAELVPLASHLIVTQLPPGPRQHASRDPQEIAEAARQAGISSVEVIEDQQAAYVALLARPEPMAIVTGSTYLLEYIRPSVVRG